MNIDEAKKLVQNSIMANKPDCLLVDDLTNEFSSCFTFHFQSKKYLKSNDHNDMYVGHNAIIVCKETGQIFETSSTYSIEKFVNAFEACGNPYGQATPSILITGWRVGANTVKAIKFIKDASNINLAEAKSLIDKVLKNNHVTITVSSIDKVSSALSFLSECGFESNQIWSNES